MVRQEDAVLVLFRMREVVLRSSLSGNILEYLDDAAIVYLIQGFFPHPLHGLVDTERSDAIRSIKIEIFRGQPYDLALSQCAHQREVDCQMQDRVLHAVQSRPHFLHRPDGALLRGLLGAVHGNRTFDKNAHSTAYWKAVPSSRCTSWMVVPERNRCFCFSVSSCFFPSIYEPQGVLLRVV